MKGSRFTAALRMIMKFVGEGLIGMGMMWAGHPLDDVWEKPDRPDQPDQADKAGETARDDPDQPPAASLSTAERAEWAALVERLR